MFYYKSFLGTRGRIGIKTLIVKQQELNILRMTGLFELDKNDEIGDWCWDHAGQGASLDPEKIKIFFFIFSKLINQAWTFHVQSMVLFSLFSFSVF